MGRSPVLELHEPARKRLLALPGLCLPAHPSPPETMQSRERNGRHLARSWRVALLCWDSNSFRKNGKILHGACRHIASLAGKGNWDFQNNCFVQPQVLLEGLQAPSYSRLNFRCKDLVL